MKRYGMLLVVLLFLLLTATGCWGRSELNEIAIAFGLGIDKAGDKYRVTVQVVDPGEIAPKKGTSNRAPVAAYDETSETIFGALRKIISVAPRKVYLSHLQMVVISEQLAREGIGESMDLLSRALSAANRFFYSRGERDRSDANTQSNHTTEKIPAQKMKEALGHSEKEWAPWKTVKLDELRRDLMAEGKELVLTGISLRGNERIGQSRENVELIDSPATITTTAIAVFKDDRLIGWLNELESIGYNYVVDNVVRTVEENTCPGEEEKKIAIEIMRAKTEMKKGKVMNGKPLIIFNSRGGEFRRGAMPSA